MINNATIYKEIVSIMSEPTLLWENPNPNTFINALTVELDGSGCDGYIIESTYSNKTTSGLKAYNMVFMGETTALRCGATVAGIASGRGVGNVTENSISFSKGYDTTGNVANTLCIPLRIWGFKFTL